METAIGIQGVNGQGDNAAGNAAHRAHRESRLVAAGYAGFGSCGIVLLICAGLYGDAPVPMFMLPFVAIAPVLALGGIAAAVAVHRSVPLWILATCTVVLSMLPNAVDWFAGQDSALVPVILTAAYLGYGLVAIALPVWAVAASLWRAGSGLRVATIRKALA